MPRQPPYNRPLLAIIVIGVVGAILTWALAPYLMVFFIFGMLAAAITVALIQDKRPAHPDAPTPGPKAPPPAACPHCGYDLRGLPLLTMKCPECGRLLTDA